MIGPSCLENDVSNASRLDTVLFPAPIYVRFYGPGSLAPSELENLQRLTHEMITMPNSYIISVYTHSDPEELLLFQICR